MPDAPAVFLTGGTGFVGGAVLDHLLSQGRRVTALVRNESDAEIVTARGAEPVLGSLQDEGSLREGMRDCGVVYHVAGLNSTCLHDASRLDEVNVAGTRSVVHAAAATGVERIVYTSSAATIGEPRGVVATETTPHRGSYVTLYERSKHRAEVAAFEEADRLGVALVAVNPSSVQGPGRTGGTARILIAYLRGRLRFAVGTRLSTVYIEDVARAHLAAEGSGEPGERYLVSGWTTTVAKAVATLGLLTGEERRVRYLPGPLLTVTAGAVGSVFRLLRRDAPLCPEMARALRHGHTYDGSRIEREWGFEYTPVEEWLSSTIAWYRAEGIA